MRHLRKFGLVDFAIIKTRENDMTFKEKLQMEHPEMVDKRFGGGGVKACPYHYGYEKDLNCVFWDSNEKCEECWNREMPNTEEFIEPKCTFETEVENAYKQGLNDAWELVKKLRYLGSQKCKEIFGYEFSIDIIEHFTPQEALAKLKAYEERIEVGDVIQLENGHLMCVTITDQGHMCGIDEIGRVYIDCDIKEHKKTGKHIDIKSILDSIGD